MVSLTVKPSTSGKDSCKVTVLIPGDNVGEILICKSGEKLNEKSQTKTDANL